MAEISSFPNNSDIYQGAEEVMRWLHGRTSGVYAGEGNAAVSATGDAMQIQVAPGIGWIVDAAANGVCWWFDTAIQLTIDPAESTGTLNRIDRVIVEWQTTDYAALPEVKILKGTSASTAVAPNLTNNSTVRQLSLARINIPAGTTELTQLNILDDRQDPTVCGIVTETVTADTSMIAAQYQEALDLLVDAIAQAWSGVISDGSITEAKLAPAVIDKIGVKSVNGNTGTVVLSIEPEWELVWTNASPSSSFGSQKVPLDLTGRTQAKIVFNEIDSGYVHPPYVGLFDLTGSYGVMFSYRGYYESSTTYLEGRRFTIASDGITFDNGTYEGFTGAAQSAIVNNGMVIPYKIFVR